MSLLAVLLVATSCNDEWTEEQYTRYVSFKASINDNGVTAVYVPYTRHNEDSTAKYGEEGLSNYRLPIIISGSLTNDREYTVKVAHDTDTLATLNYARFQNRTDLYYVDMSDYATYPNTVTIEAGKDKGILDIQFDFRGIDLVDKWVLPLTIVDEGTDYKRHPRKNYAKAMLRIYPFNDYSGDYSATTLTLANSYDTSNAIGLSYSRAYVVDENTVFFYAGNIDETRTDRHLYKIYAQFGGDGTQGDVTMWSDNPDMQFTTDGSSTYRVYEQMDEVQPYLKHRYVIINNINYSYVDYTLATGTTFSYTASGTLTLERQINTQIPDEDQAIEWE